MPDATPGAAGTDRPLPDLRTPPPERPYLGRRARPDARSLLSPTALDRAAGSLAKRGTISPTTGGARTAQTAAARIDGGRDDRMTLIWQN